MRRKRSAILAFILLLANLPACGVEPPPPELDHLEPDWGYNGERTEVRVYGSYFLPRVELDPREDGGRLDRQFELELVLGDERYPLEQVTLEDYRVLEAVVPKGLPVGTYDLELHAPTGAEARGAALFTVTDTRADHLAFDVSDVSYEANQWFWIPFRLEDPEGDPVAQSLDVTFTVTSEQGAAGVVFEDSSWGDTRAEEVEGGYRLRGQLSELGDGYVALLSTVPDVLDLEVAPAEPDSVVDAAELKVSVDPGQVAAVSIELPSADFTAVAGEPFDLRLQLVDAYGNPQDAAEATVVLSELCGGATRDVSVQGHAELSFAVEGATGDDCPENRLEAYGTVSGESAPFQVEPGPAASYRVEAFPSRVVAGESSLGVVVQAEDAFGNRVDDYQAELVLRDEVGGLDLDAGLGDYACGDFEQGECVCSAALWRAAEEDRVVVSGEDGLVGTSNAVQVTPGPVAYLSLVAPAQVVAGEPFTLEVLPSDRFANPVSTDPSVETFRFEGSPGELSCEWDGVLSGDGLRRFDCTATLATPSQELRVELETAGGTVSRSADPFEVVNGEPAAFELEGLAEGDEWVAGEPHELSFAVFDAWGNPYLHQSAGSSLLLSDDSGSLSPTSLALGSDGTATGSFLVTVAGEDQLHLELGGVDLGSSPGFTVVPADAASLELDPGEPWALLGSLHSVTVTALDAYGNTVTGFSDPVTVSSAGGAAEDVTVDAVGGVATAVLEPTVAVVGDSLVARSGGLEGSYAPFDFVDGDCGTVTAELLVEGSESWVACLPAGGGSASLALDASGSSGADTYVFYEPSTGLLLRGSSSSTTASWGEEGGYGLALLALDSSTGCGDVARVPLWVAEDDGRPAGPVELSLDASWLVLGNPGASTATLSVSAWDCAGDVASGGTLYLRTELGELDSGVTATGEGLSLLLDAKGQGSASWTVAGETHGGWATLYAGRLDGAASGSLEVRVLGDDARPHVVAIDPQGWTAGEVEQVSVWFDEAMDEDSFTYPDPDGVEILLEGSPVELAELDFDEDENRLDILPAEPLDTDGQVYTLYLSDQLRDLSGNALDGTWTGSRSAFTAELGDVPVAAPSLLSCLLSTSTFRPDGDDGMDEEADQVEVLVEADGVPAWWRLEVLDELDETVRVVWVPAVAEDETLPWDGRRADGRVADNGTYLLRVQPMDASLNLGAGCELRVLLDNRVVEIP